MLRRISENNFSDAAHFSLAAFMGNGSRRGRWDSRTKIILIICGFFLYKLSFAKCLKEGDHNFLNLASTKKKEICFLSLFSSSWMKRSECAMENKRSFYDVAR